ncbi:cAMP-independent regulatory pac2 [Cordyceps militaris]|uniref:cAMP-independent regulatory pac2 n=1 Tax=Cordyceps militaris TaxID=73501 RepID=A0A2H4S645_CORMI|nr:cAMP-independent regulatory pac2 [Cordyceps militaris]
MENQSTPLTPTFEGHISSTLDALLLFEGCLDGTLNHVPRRPHDRERQELIKSGNIFIYEEHSSGIKRWTDGVSWSPSRILGNFLIYRELEKPFPPGEKKRALKKSKKSPQGVVKSEPVSHANLPYVAAGLDQSNSPKDQERSLIGSLVDSYPFKVNGLVKKTISISYHGVAHHLVSYYNVDDVTSGKLDTPTNTHLRGLTPRPDLFCSQSFRVPIEEHEYAVAENGGPIPAQYGPDSGTMNGGVLRRAMMQGNLQPAMGSMQQHSSPTPYMFPQASPATHHGYPGHGTNSSFQPAMSQQMTYAANPVGNYSLDPTRGDRFPPAAVNPEFPQARPMASHAHAHLGHTSYYLPPQHQAATPTPTFPMSRGMRPESDGMPDETVQHSYNFDNGPWGFTPMEGDPEQQQYYGQTPSQWSNEPHSLPRA